MPGEYEEPIDAKGCLMGLLCVIVAWLFIVASLWFIKWR